MAIAGLRNTSPLLYGLQAQARPVIAYFLFSAVVYHCENDKIVKI